MDIRKQRSQKKLRLALANQLQEKSLSEITIDDLATSAGVSRQTFYSNFPNKQAVLLVQIDRLFFRCQQYSHELLGSGRYGRQELIRLGVEFLIDECEKDVTLLREAFNGQAGIMCLEPLKGYIMELVSREHLGGLYRGLNPTQFDIVLDFYAGALVGLIRRYLLADDRDDFRELVVSEATRLIPHGLDAHLR